MWRSIETNYVTMSKMTAETWQEKLLSWSVSLLAVLPPVKWVSYDQSYNWATDMAFQIYAHMYFVPARFIVLDERRIIVSWHTLLRLLSSFAFETHSQATRFRFQAMITLLVKLLLCGKVFFCFNIRCSTTLPAFFARNCRHVYIRMKKRKTNLLFLLLAG